PRGTVLEDDARAGGDDPRAARLVEALDQRDGSALGVDRDEVRTSAARERRRRRVERARGIDERAPGGEVVGGEKRRGEGRVREMRARVGEGELHGLDLRMEARTGGRQQ